MREVYTLIMIAQQHNNSESAEPRTDEHPFPEPDALSIPLISGAEMKHLLRGWLHLGTTPIALIGGIVMIALAVGPIAKWGAVVYLTSSLLLFGVSAVYHRLNWSHKVKAALRRFDHANIFLLIAGTYTPLVLGTLPLDQAKNLLIVVWSGAFIGIIFRVFWLTAPSWIYVPLYIGLGWAAVFYLADIGRGSLPAMILVIIGGLLYTIGAVIYAFKWPNPSPKNFGFHEIFHALTVLAFFCHWVAALLAVLDPLYLR